MRGSARCLFAGAFFSAVIGLLAHEDISLARGECNQTQDIKNVCFQMRQPCGELRVGDYVLGVGSTQNDTEHLLASISGDPHSEICPVDSHCLVDRSLCPKGVPGLACGLVALTIVILNLVLLVLHCAWEQWQLIMGAAYWINDFYVGLCISTLVVENASVGRQPTLETYLSSCAATLLATQLIETVLYDGPLVVVKRCCPSLFVLAAVALGTVPGLTATYMAYSPLDVAVLGHHALLLGLGNWALDFVKHIVWYNVKGRLCGSIAEVETYKPLVAELTDVLPATE